MKKQFLLVILLISVQIYAQGGGFNYKAIITDNGTVLASQSVTIQFTLLENGTTTVYQETHTTTTDTNGIVSVIIGEGSTSDNFSTIDWAINPIFLQVEIDTGSGYTDFGTTEFNSVPYAKVAEKADNVFSGDYNDLIEKPELFYIRDTSNPATNIWSNMYHSGNLSLGHGESTNIGNSYSKLQIFFENPYDYKARGIEIIMSEAISGPITGIRNIISADGEGIHYGILNNVGGSGGGLQYGTYNQVGSQGHGDHFGTYNHLGQSGNGDHYGVYNKLDGANTSSDEFGVYNILEGTTGKQYGVKTLITNTNSNNNPHYGIYNELTGTGPGAKYGSYNLIATVAGGTHYAVYGEAEKTGSYAGYFKGDVTITNNIKGKIKAETSGDADMKAYLYGYITGSGGIVTEKSSSGFTVSRIVEGKYRVHFSDDTLTTTNFVVVANSISTSDPEFITYVTNTSEFDIYVWKHDGTHQDSDFSFVVYKK